VHISQLSDKFVKNPADVVNVNQKVLVTVLTVDTERKRISLSMKSDASPPDNPGQILGNKIIGVDFVLNEEMY